VAELPVYLELGRRRVFAGALDWPGWCRAGRDEAAALEALAAATVRYQPIAAAAGLALPAAVSPASFEIVERLAGSATTDFGAPGAIPEHDRTPPAPAQLERMLALVEASWQQFDAIVRRAPASLRKGPRGGGRDRDPIVEHVLGAEVGYGSALGVRLAQPGRDDPAAVAAHRARILAGLRAAGQAAAAPRRWPAAYAARRIAWHVLDHAWEIEDRSTA